MNYCCEAYVSLYREPCGYHKGRYDAHTCPQIDPSHLRSRYFDLLMDGPGKLKPKSDTCPFCKQSLLNTGKYPKDMTGLEYATLEDVSEDRAVHATRHVLPPVPEDFTYARDPEAAASLVGKMFS